jgi:hypothetical protein
MAFLGIKLIGDKEIVAHLQEAPQQVAEAIGAMFEGHLGPSIVETARSIAPVDTGTFRDSIAATVGGSGLIRDMTISSGVSYALFIEFGTYKWKGKPTLRPALAAHSSQIEAGVQQAVEAALNW